MFPATCKSWGSSRKTALGLEADAHRCGRGGHLHFAPLGIRWEGPSVHRRLPSRASATADNMRIFPPGCSGPKLPMLFPDITQALCRVLPCKLPSCDVHISSPVFQTFRPELRLCKSRRIESLRNQSSVPIWIPNPLFSLSFGTISFLFLVFLIRKHSKDQNFLVWQTGTNSAGLFC